MSLPPVLPNTDTFLGVALVLNRNREGPRFVFHYPGRIHPRLCSSQREFSEQLEDESCLGDGALASAAGSAREFLPNAGELARWNHDDHIATDSGTQVAPWEYVAGVPTKALEGILTPPRAFHKKRFQILLDSVYYVSYPIHVPTSGFWDREKRRKGRARPPADGDAKGDAKETAKEDKVSSMTMFNLVFIFNPRQHEANDLLDVMYTNVIREVNKVYKYCQESGDFVWQECKKIIQLKDVARENRTRMSVLWEQILTASSLAASMRDVYEAVCRNRISVLELSLGKGSVSHSVQIPMPFYVADIQPQGSAAARNLFLTTANSLSSYDMLGGLAAFDKCTALLLTDDDDKNIIAELQARRDKAATAMIELVKAAKPTLSFHQIAQLPETILTIQQVRAYAQHFIYWRRAMAVPPIHARDVYVLSPNCDLANLPRASAAFAHTFSFAPPLADLLARLSTAPRPYKSFCPTKNLRPAYLRILAWLIRGGWVCQICTYAYVVVWPEVQYEVEYGLETEALARIKQRQQRGSGAGIGAGTGSVREKHRQRRRQRKQGGFTTRARTASDASDNDRDGGDSESAESDTSSTSSASIKVRPKESIAGAADGRPGPSAAEHAAERARQQRIAEKAARDLAERATVHARKPVPTRTDHPSVNDAPHLAGMKPHIILDASRPTGRESLYLSAIGQHLRSRRSAPPPASKKDDYGDSAAAAAHLRKTPGAKEDGRDETTVWNERVADMWPVYWKYFNGHVALERISLLEDAKRKDVWNLLTAMSEYLLCVRHW